MNTEEKIQRVKQIFGEMDALQAELAEIIGGTDSKKKQRGGGASRERVPVAKPEPETKKQMNHADGTLNKRGAAAGIKAPGHACCGSKGWRHKSTCSRLGAKDEDSDDEEQDPLDGEEADTAAAPNKKSKQYECMAEGHVFNSMLEFDEAKDVGCPHCRTKMIVQR